jgi:NAD(P)-dependent dehydrogenase (short-subunit alcohol dehydrogenase family)
MNQPKVAVITGGAGALGRVIVGEFLRGGYAVVIPHHAGSGTNPAPLPFESDPGVMLRPADLRSETDVDHFMRSVAEELGPVHSLVHAAGGYAGGSPVEELPTDEWDRMIAMNLTTCFLMCRAALRQMRAAGRGRIVTVAAMPAVVPSAGKAAYAVSKRGVASLTEQIAEETRGSGITANAIAPSVILTEANLRAMPGADSTQWVRPEEIARLAFYLCSDDARSVSGNVIRIFGGV